MLQLKPARLPVWTLYVFIGALAVLAHRFAISADFFMDDYEAILRHPGVIGGPGEDAGFVGVDFRWLPYGIWSLIHQTTGLHGSILHSLNLGVHIVIACLMLPIGRDFLRRAEWFGGSDETRLHAAALGAVVFAVHPLGTEAVHYTRCLMIDLVTLFSVLSAWCALRFAEKPNFRWALFLATALIFATISKRPGFAHAAANIAIVGLAFVNWRKLGSGIRENFVAGPEREATKRYSTKFSRIPLRAWLAIPLALIAIFFAAHWIRWGVHYLGKEQLLVPHALTQGRVFWEYALRIFFPTNLSADHYVPWTLSWRDAPSLAGLLGVIVLAAGCGWMILTKQTRFRLLGAILALALAPLLMRFGYVVKELFVEYRVYPALPWIGLLAGCGLITIVKWNRLIGLSVCAAVLTGCIVLSNGRSALWTDSAMLAEDCLRAYPLNMRALTLAQNTAYLQGDDQRVLELTVQAEQLLAANEEFNATHEHRQFELNRVYQHYAIAHQFATYAIARQQGVDTAIGYADQVIKSLEQRFPGTLDPEHNAMLKARALLGQLAATE